MSLTRRVFPGNRKLFPRHTGQQCRQISADTVNSLNTGHALVSGCAEHRTI